ncbi:MAG: transketolase [Candidatus Levybacteria bacterium RIFCSPLOWO2_01_FULL_36_13]|nr:MAG: transketolase [Candidatus Levybacteria bacterium RIFCSPHIGHO2_01_FULL_36_15b]OGH35407.1 MAG: transketolase [Candidatus Levybacteria bacterium RIFCSPLOWO2_01_FULL_36_13]
MLNPDLHLNQKLFDKDVEQKATRDGFGEALVELGESNPNVVVLTADLSESTRTDGFEAKFPQRFFEVGVAEQNMAAIAAGLGLSGKIPFISSYATFSPGKNWETIRTTIIYGNSNVKIAGHHSGIMTGPDGATHQATEDIAITRAWPNISVFVPCDAIEAKKATLKSAEIRGPVYLRFTRDKTPIITTKDTPFSKEVEVYWINEAPKTVIFATGYMLYYALLAAKNLEEKGIKVQVANVSTIKPIDSKTIIKLAKEAGKVVTVEDHQVAGGLGGTIAEVLAKHYPTPMEFIGLQDTFAESGAPFELIKKYGMDEVAIEQAVTRLIGNQNE